MRTVATIAAVLLAAHLGWAATEGAPKDFKLLGLDGKPFELSSVLGKKTVVINFWAGWCESCKEELPQLVALQKSPGASEALFLGINVGENAKKAQRFLDRYHYPYQVLLDQDKSTAKVYGVTGVPTTIIISAAGTIVFRGSRPPEKLPQ